MTKLRFTTGLKYGVITSILSILIGMALYFMGLNDFSGSGTSSLVTILILILGIYLGVEAFKQANNGYATTGDIVMMSLYLGVVMGLISGLFWSVYLNFIDASILDKIMSVTEARMEEAGQSEEQMEMAMSITRKMMSPGWFTLVSLLMNLVFAAIVGALMSIFLKKEPAVFD